MASLNLLMRGGWFGANFFGGVAQPIWLSGLNSRLVGNTLVWMTFAFKPIKLLHQRLLKCDKN